jgi:hypothetical protein
VGNFFLNSIFLFILATNLKADCIFESQNEVFSFEKMNIDLSDSGLKLTPKIDSKCPGVNSASYVQFVKEHTNQYQLISGKKLAEKVMCWGKEKFSDPKKVWPHDLGWVSGALASGDRLWYPSEKSKIWVNHLIKLEQFLDDQPFFSVTPDSLLKKSAEITGGNIQESLALCWNFLRRGAVEANQKNKKNPMSENEVQQNLKEGVLFGNRTEQNLTFHQLKLKSMTGEATDYRPLDHEHQLNYEAFLNGRLKEDKVTEKGVSVRGDEVSAWYHFFGTAIHSFSRAQSVGFIPTQVALWLEYNVTSAKKKIGTEKLNLIEKEGIVFGETLAAQIKEKRSTPTKTCKEPKNSFFYEDASLLPKDYALNGGDVWSQKERGMSAIERVYLLIGFLRSNQIDTYQCYFKELLKLQPSNKAGGLTTSEIQALRRGVLSSYRNYFGQDAVPFLKSLLNQKNSEWSFYNEAFNDIMNERRN